MRALLMLVLITSCTSKSLTAPTRVVQAPATPAWTWEHPRPQGNTITAIASAGASVMVVGERGAALISEADGLRFRVVPTGVQNHLRAVVATSGGWIVVGDRGTILRWTGTAFEIRRSPVAENLVDVVAVEQRIYAISTAGSVVRSLDGGTTFERAGGLGAGNFGEATAIAVTATGTILVGTWGGLWRGDGSRFVRTAIVEPVQRLATKGPNVYALGGGRVMYDPAEMCGSCIGASYEVVALFRSNDGGTTWQRRVIDDGRGRHSGWGSPTPSAEPPQPPDIVRGGVMPPRTIFSFVPRDLAFGPRGKIHIAVAKHLFTSSDDNAFAKSELPGEGSLWATTAGTLILAGEQGRITRSTNVGRSWNDLGGGREAKHPPENLTGVTITPDGAAFAVGMPGILLRHGAGWQAVATPATHSLRNIVALDDDHVVAVGFVGTIVQSTDGGTTFALRASGTTEHFSALWGHGREAVAVGHGGVVVRSSDSGATWQTMPPLTSQQGWGISLWGSSVDDLYLVTFYGQILRSVDRATSWREVTPSSGPYRAVWGSAADAVYFVGEEGSIAFSSDGGATLVRQRTGTKQKLFAVWGRGAGDVFAGGEILLRSSDRGQTWREETLPIGAVYAIAGNREEVLVVGEKAQILRHR